MASNSKIRECIESLVIAGGLALVIRGFVIEAFVVPTGSMAPTIYGRNLAPTCAHCGHHFAVKWGWDADERPRVENCPRCNKPVDPTYFAFSRGDRLLVNKFLHKMRGLRRWEIVVFWCPDPKIRKNYIKRLVGLPGETVRIIDGDLYIDGAIKRKPSHVQRYLWVPVHEAEFDGTPPQKYWSLAGDRCRIEDGMLRLSPPEDGYEAALRYADRIDDYVIYNAGKDRRGDEYPEVVSLSEARPGYGNTLVRDVRLEAEADIEDGSALVVDLAAGDGPSGMGAPALRFVVRAGEGTSTVTDVFGNTVWRKELGLAGGRHRVECAHVDAAIHLSVDDLVMTYEYEPVPAGRRPKPAAAVGAMGGGVGVHRVTLDRDIYYSESRDGSIANGVDYPYTLSARTRNPATGKMTGENEYFFLGDNSRSSRDCRVLDLEKYPILEKYIRGKAIVRFWPPRRIGAIR